MQTSAAYWLRRSSLASAAVSLTWAWVTFSYWEAGPLLSTITTTGFLAALSVWVGRHRLISAAGVGIVVALANFIAVFAITGMRWEG
jgi:hypothetical protein